MRDLQFTEIEGRDMKENKLKKRCAKHAQFLFSQMRNPSAASMGWSDTPFYKWLAEETPDIYERYKPKARATPPLHQSRRASPWAIHAARVNSAQTIVSFMHELHHSKRLRISQMNMKALVSNLYERFDIEHEELAREVIIAHAKRIYDSLGEEWHLSPVYQKLEAFASEQQKLKRSDLQAHALNLELRIRAGIQDVGVVEHGQSHTVHTPAGKRTSPQQAREESPASAVPGPMRREGKGKTIGKSPSLRLKGTPSRKRSLTLSDEEGDVRASKRLNRGPDAAEEESADEQVDEDEAEEDMEDLEETAVAESVDQLELKSIPLPPSSPAGPNGCWTCPKEACGITIPGADKPEGRAKVQSHFLKHADEIAARESMVKLAQRPYLPIENLLEKLRQLGESARSGEEHEREKIGDRVVPTPVKRKVVT